MVLNLNKLESPSPIDALCQGWLKLTLCFALCQVEICPKFLDIEDFFKFGECIFAAS